jgi:hypothetical protein
MYSDEGVGRCQAPIEESPGQLVDTIDAAIECARQLEAREGMNEPSLFEVSTPLGFTVRTTYGYWQLIQRKHPEVQGKEPEVRQCLIEPEIIRRSTQDSAVYLFYRPWADYHLAVVVKRLNGEGFIITSYLTDAIKEGEEIWPTSA